MRSMVNVLESILCHRVITAVEPLLDQAQFASRRGRGAEMRLTDKTFCYLISFDIAGAFER